jgi:hypothetical protein
MGRCHGNDYGDVRPMSAEEQELLFDATLILIPVPGASAYGSVKLLRFMAKHPKITKNLCVVTMLCGLPPTSKAGLFPYIHKTLHRPSYIHLHYKLNHEIH